MIELRVEAPEHVDDTDVTYADGHRLYIQAKEEIQTKGPTWAKLWDDFQQQYSGDRFVRGRDQLALHVGTSHVRFQQLKEACERASTSQGYVEWQGRLTQEQQKLVESIRGLLGDDLAEDENLLEFFKHIQVKDWPLFFIEGTLLHYQVPPSNVMQKTLFSLLRDRVGGQARVRGTFKAATLVEQLQLENHVRLVVPPVLAICGQLYLLVATSCASTATPSVRQTCTLIALSLRGSLSAHL